MGFTQSKADPYIYLSDKEAFHIGVYVDDILLTGDLSRIQEVKHQLGEQFEVKDLGKLNYFLGINVETAAEGKELWMGQPTYVEQLLDAQKMSSCKAVGTPVDPGGHLTSATEEEETVTQHTALPVADRYLTTCTSPDIAFAVGMLAKFSSKPHWTAAKRVLRYLYRGPGTMEFSFANRKNLTVGDTQMLTGLGTERIEDRLQATSFNFAPDPSRGDPRSILPWHYQPQKRNM